MKKNKEVKYKVFDTLKVRKTEFVVSLVLGIIFLIMLGFAICNKVFIPITLIIFAMFLFSICCYYIDDKNKKTTIYILFTLGIIFIIAEVIYTIGNVCNG